MTLWVNVTGQEVTRRGHHRRSGDGRELQRRRTYDDRLINTFDDGFVVQYTVNVVLHDGKRASLWACVVAAVHDGRIVRLDEYIDSTKFRRPGRRRRR